jgi:hypothetical protein
MTVLIGDIKAPAKCIDCGKQRTNEPDYSPIQAVLRLPLGWYSGDDGEFCPDDIAKIMNMGNRPGPKHEAWKS